MGFWNRLFSGPIAVGAAPPTSTETEEERLAKRRALLKRVRKLEIVTRRIVNDQVAGSYQSAFKGRGMDFDEVRLYQPGDEVRFIDWNVSARMNDLYIKQFEEERELTVMLLVDASASQAFGTGRVSKQEATAEVGAMLAFSAIKNNDRVGLIIFTDQIELFVPPKKGRKHVLRVIREILEHQPTQTGTSISGALDFFAKVTKRRSVAFLLSDFQDRGYRRGLQATCRRHDVIPIVMVDPAEEEIPKMGTVAFEDPESAELIYVDTESRKGRRLYRELVKTIHERREQVFRKLKVDFVTIRTNEGYFQPIVNYFRLRAKRY